MPLTPTPKASLSQLGAAATTQAADTNTRQAPPPPDTPRGHTHTHTHTHTHQRHADRPAPRPPRPPVHCSPAPPPRQRTCLPSHRARSPRRTMGGHTHRGHFRPRSATLQQHLHPEGPLFHGLPRLITTGVSKAHHTFIGVARSLPRAGRGQTQGCREGRSLPAKSPGQGTRNQRPR